MNIKVVTLLPVAASSLVLALALATPAIASSDDPDFGCTVRRNIELQTVDMDPKYAGTLIEGGIGRRSSAAVSRYMNDKVRPLLQLNNRTDVGSQGGADSSSGSGPAAAGGGN